MEANVWISGKILLCARKTLLGIQHPQKHLKRPKTHQKFHA